MTLNRIPAGLLLLVSLAGPASADNFARLDEALPSTVDISGTSPVFDFDTDGCLPSAGISRAGAQNGGLKPSGSITGGCRSSSFLDTSNTLHRHACIHSDGKTYCGHFYALYFLKDQATALGGGHRHDWEYAAVWTTNGVVTHGGYSAHGDLTNAAVASLPMQYGHLKIVGKAFDYVEVSKKRAEYNTGSRTAPFMSTGPSDSTCCAKTSGSRNRIAIPSSATCGGMRTS